MRRQCDQLVRCLRRDQGLVVSVANMTRMVSGTELGE